MVTDKGIDMCTVCIDLHLNVVQKYMYSIFSELLQILLPLCNRTLNNANFTKRLEAATFTKDFELCKFQFQITVALFSV